MHAFPADVLKREEDYVERRMRAKHSIFISMFCGTLAIYSSSSTAGDVDSVAGYRDRIQIADFHSGDRDGTGGHTTSGDINGLGRAIVPFGQLYQGDIDGLVGKPRIMPGEEDGVMEWVRVIWNMALSQCPWRF